MYWTVGLIFLAVAVVAAVFGWGVLKAPQRGFAKVLFYIFAAAGVMFLLIAVVGGDPDPRREEVPPELRVDPPVSDPDTPLGRP